MISKIRDWWEFYVDARTVFTVGLMGFLQILFVSFFIYVIKTY